MTRRSPARRAARQAPRGITPRARRGSAPQAPGRAPADDAPRHGRIRIVVADHQAIDRAGLAGLLAAEDGFEIAGEAASIEDSIRQCRSLAPDVLVVSLNLPAQERGATIPAIRAALPELGILALSERGAENCLVLNPPSRRWLTGLPLATCPAGIDCLQLAAHQGALATLRRSADPADLFQAIRAVARGQAWYDPTTAAGMRSAAAGPRGRRLFSERETQVAALLVEAHSNKEIAAALGIREPTVKKHVTHILDKLGLEDRLQAGLYLARNPLLLDR